MKGSESACGEGNRAAMLRVAESRGRTGACVRGEVCAGCGRGTCCERHSIKRFGDINSRRDTKLHTALLRQCELGRNQRYRVCTRLTVLGGTGGN